MTTIPMIGRSACAVVASVALLFSAATASAQSLPPEVQTIVAPLSASPEDTATKDVLALNTAMFELYGNSAQIFQANLLATHPIILALFSGAGGRLILYRPGQPPIDAPSVPPVYQLLKSVGHSTMALAEVVIPYLSTPRTSPGAPRCSPIAAGCNRRRRRSTGPRCRPTGVPTAKRS